MCVRNVYCKIHIFTYLVIRIGQLFQKCLHCLHEREDEAASSPVRFIGLPFKKKLMLGDVKCFEIVFVDALCYALQFSLECFDKCEKAARKMNEIKFEKVKNEIYSLARIDVTRLKTRGSCIVEKTVHRDL